MSELIEVKTADLTGQALDWAVAIAVHGKVYVYPEGGLCPPEDTISLNEDDGTMRVNSGGFHPKDSWSPSTDWSQGGPLIEKYQVALVPEAHDGLEGTEMSERWYADIYYDGGEQYTTEHCETPLIAASRAIVAAYLGDTVSIPAELII
ncbi:phage protein NinX family protein [Pseudomonas sp. ZS001]|uniref:phage protein NinX family protein n=1 Tax=Pseudomonas sp. ZS001 TaxID=3138070 RepID=UPI003138EF88